MKQLIYQTALSVLIALSILAPSSVAQDQEAITRFVNDGPVSRMAITTGLDSEAYPISNLSILDSTAERVVFYTEINGIPGIPVAHRWIYEGVLVATIVLPVNANYVRVWSWLSVDDSMVGNWEAQVVDINGYVLAVRPFQIVNPKDSSVQDRLRDRLRNDCEDRILDLLEELEEDPDNAYLQFLLQQQLSRCQ